MQSARPGRGYRFLLSGTILFSASLLFIVEPFIGKFVLPYFGGGSGVWSVALLFFTLLLLVGYGVGHFVSRLGALRALRLHLVVLVACAVVIALEWIAFGVPLMPPSPGNFSELFPGFPPLAILTLLAFSAGLPFFLLSTTSTMLQLWSSYVDEGQEPYRLYALSNFASLLGLLAYPLVLEPLFSLHTLAWVWGVFFGLYLIGYIFLARLTLRMVVVRGEVAQVHAPESDTRPSARMFLEWVFYAGLPACLLVAVTSGITRDVSPIPLFWVIPLALYLVSYATAFGVHRLGSLFVDSTAFFSIVALLFSIGKADPLISGVLYLIAFFFITHLCHCLLYRARPSETALAYFYFAVALGGALGTIIGALVVPVVFQYPIEYPLLLTVGLFVALVHMRALHALPKYPRIVLTIVIPALLFSGSLFVAMFHVAKSSHVTRNFYGTLLVHEYHDPDLGDYRMLTHGRIFHGMQFRSPELARIPTTYYATSSAVGKTILPKSQEQPSLSVGVVGLGSGTVGAYCRPRDQYTFYEINPEVIDVAYNWFTYLRDCPLHEVVSGDARLAMERAVASGDTKRYDVLLVDAFSSDAIPVHLLTREAFALYRSLLRDDTSVLLVHVSNGFLDLAPVVLGGARSAGLRGVVDQYTPSSLSRAGITSLGETRSSWVALSSGDLPSTFDQQGTEEEGSQEEVEWTDDFSNLFSQLKMFQ